MENASKAIVMAGGILIGVMILSVAAYLIMVFGDFSSSMAKKIGGEKNQQFNNNFEVFVGRMDIEAQEIVSIVNYAKRYNSDNNLNPTDNEYIHVYVDSTDYSTSSDSNILLTSGNLNKYYSCCAEQLGNVSKDTTNNMYIIQYRVINSSANRIEYSNSSGKVNKIYFKTLNISYTIDSTHSYPYDRVTRESFKLEQN